MFVGEKDVIIQFMKMFTKDFKLEAEFVKSELKIKCCMHNRYNKRIVMNGGMLQDLQGSKS